jgi:Dolichyl-phosphate-mannose-protein mannosyltransferase
LCARTGSTGRFAASLRFSAVLRGEPDVPSFSAAYEQPGTRDVGIAGFWAAVGVCALGVAAFLLARLHAWPPHEDETLALFVGRSSLSDLLGTVQGERGGAPLHFVVAWTIVKLDGGLTALRLVSALAAVASVPVVAALLSRLAGRTAALVGTLLVSTSWMLLFHGVYARMYSLFLLCSALSYFALLVVLQRGGAGRWALWGLSAVATVAVHPYGALVLASQGLYVLVTRARVREAVAAFAVVALVGAPFWYADLVLASRFDVGVGGGGAKLSGPIDVLHYLFRTAGDFSAGYLLALLAALALGIIGFRRLWLDNTHAAWLAGLVFAVPAIALTAARLGHAASPEARHLIFALPFFGLVVAVGLLELGEWRPDLRRSAPAAALAALVAVQVAWAWDKTPALFEGEPASRVAAREAASAWLAATARPDDVFFGYDPLHLGAWERNEQVSRVVVPRADPKLALETLLDEQRPLGRGVWVLDASDTNNFAPRLTIERRVPRPAYAFEARAYGPFLVIRSRRPTETPRTYLELSARAMRTGKSLLIGDADINAVTVTRATARLDGYETRSLSTSSR